MGFFSRFVRPSRISELGTRIELKQQIKRARILVIDDDPNAFPVELLKQEGYNIVEWRSVTSLAPLENGEYDIIILDLNGIATPEQSRTDGIGILKNIKSYNPSQIVVAFSAKKYDFHQAEFWKLADDYIGKPSSLDVCKQKIDDLLVTKYNPDYYWSKLRESLLAQGASPSDISALEKVIAKRLSKGQRISLAEMADLVKLGKESISAGYVIFNIIAKLLLDGSPP